MRTFGLWVALYGPTGTLIGQQSTMFESANGGLANMQSLTFTPNFSGEASRVALRNAPDAPALIEFDLDRPVTFTAGSSLVCAPASLKVHGEGNPSVIGWMEATMSAPDATFEAFIEANPEATVKDIWMAGFAAGCNITTILYTGDA